MLSIRIRLKLFGDFFDVNVTKSGYRRVVTATSSLSSIKWFHNFHRLAYFTTFISRLRVSRWAGGYPSRPKVYVYPRDYKLQVRCQRPSSTWPNLIGQASGCWRRELIKYVVTFMAVVKYQKNGGANANTSPS